MTDQITARLDRLEKRCRRLTIGATALGLALAAAVTVSAVAEPAVQDMVRARGFELIDDEGELRAFLNVTGNDDVILSLIDKQGVQRWFARIDKHGPSLILSDEEDNTRWAARAWEDGTRLELSDEKGELRWLAVVDENRTFTFLADEKGKTRWAASVSEDGPRTWLVDEKGVTRATLGSTTLVTPRTGVETKRPEGSLVLFGPDGNATFEAPR